MRLIHVIIVSLCTLILTNCSSAQKTLPLPGTGTYPNSAYVSTESKALEPAVFGASSGAPELKIFSDYQCPACINFHKAIEERLWKEYIDTKKVTVTFYNYPLTMTSASGKPLHQNAEGDALASLCALSFGKFHEFRTEMYKMEHEKAGENIYDSERIEGAKRIGIQDVAFSSCLQSAWYQKTLEAEIAEGNRLNLRGTPSIYLSDKVVNFKSADEFFLILDGAIKNIKK